MLKPSKIKLLIKVSIPKTLHLDAHKDTENTMSQDARFTDKHKDAMPIGNGHGTIQHFS